MRKVKEKKLVIFGSKGHNMKRDKLPEDLRDLDDVHLIKTLYIKKLMAQVVPAGEIEILVADIFNIHRWQARRFYQKTLDNMAKEFARTSPEHKAAYIENHLQNVIKEAAKEGKLETTLRATRQLIDLYKTDKQTTMNLGAKVKVSDTMFEEEFLETKQLAAPKEEPETFDNNEIYDEEKIIN